MRLPKRFATSDAWGTTVAQEEITRAALRGGHCEGVHYFLRPELMNEAQAAALDHLRQEFPAASIQAFALDELQHQANQNDYIFAIELESVPRVLWYRELAHATFPVMGIVHTIPDHGYLSLYLMLCLLARECDIVLATSTAGDAAVRYLLQASADMVNRRCKQSPQDTSLTPNVCRIPLGVDTSRFLPGNKYEARTGLGLPIDCNLLLFVGRISAASKADLRPLLLVVKRLLSGDPGPRPIMLAIVGKESRDHHEVELRRTINELGVQDHVRLELNCSHEAKIAYYQAADIFVSPVDNVQETFGLAVLEAMAVGLPVVGSDWSGYRDLIEEGITGFRIRTFVSHTHLEDLGHRAALETGFVHHEIAKATVVDLKMLFEKLQLLLALPELRESMGSLGRLRASERYKWEKIAEDIAGVWRKQIAAIQPRGGDLRNPTLHFASYLGSFGTEPLERAASQRVLRITGDGVWDGLSSSELQRMRAVLAGCQPDDKGEAMDRAELDIEALGWLLKRGFMNIE